LLARGEADSSVGGAVGTDLFGGVGGRNSWFVGDDKLLVVSRREFPDSALTEFSGTSAEKETRRLPTYFLGETGGRGGDVTPPEREFARREPRRGSNSWAAAAARRGAAAADPPTEVAALAALSAVIAPEVGVAMELAGIGA
jgi:hypothetical protein